MSKRTITLTNRPPVTIEEDNWPLIASAKDSDHDNQYECQANQKWKWFVGVRQHKDGRAIVYATYTHTSQWAGSQDTYDRQGDYLDYKDVPIEHITSAIINVCARMEGERWDTLKDDCIADLPAEDLDSTPSRSPLAALMIDVEQLRRDNAALIAEKQAACQHNWLGNYCDLCGAVKPV